MNTGSFVIHIKTNNFYEDVANDVEKWFHASNYSEDNDRLLPRGINKKEIGFLRTNQKERL